VTVTYGSDFPFPINFMSLATKFLA
jgi:hypothetical protein